MLSDSCLQGIKAIDTLIRTGQFENAVDHISQLESIHRDELWRAQRNFNGNGKVVPHRARLSRWIAAIGIKEPDWAATAFVAICRVASKVVAPLSNRSESQVPIARAFVAWAIGESEAVALEPGERLIVGGALVHSLEVATGERKHPGNIWGFAFSAEVIIAAAQAYEFLESNPSFDDRAGCEGVFRSKVRQSCLDSLDDFYLQLSEVKDLVGKMSRLPELGEWLADLSARARPLVVNLRGAVDQSGGQLIALSTYDASKRRIDKLLEKSIALLVDAPDGKQALMVCSDLKDGLHELLVEMRPVLARALPGPAVDRGIERAQV